MRRCIILIGLLAGMAAILCPVQAEPAAAGNKALTETKRLVDAPGERVSVLDNGLTVILRVHRTAPVVCVQMYCRTGSIYEQEYLGAGMSHLFEHLLHGGATTGRSEEDSRRILDDIGGNTNAYTSYDQTCYFINTGREHLATAIDLLGDWITRPTFPQEAFDREWGVVQRELERDVDDPGRQLNYLTMETLYQQHPARFPIIGYQPVVQTLKKEDIVGYYHRMYVPDNIVVAIVGDIELDAALGLVEQQFSSFKRQRVPEVVLPEEPPMATPRFASRKMAVQSAVLRLAWPSIRLTDPDLYALDVLSYVLTQGDSSRLMRAIRDKGLVFTIDSYSYTPEWGPGMFAITSRLDPDKLDEAKAAILEQIADLQANLVSTGELDKAKRQKAAEHVFASQTAESVAAMVANDYLSTADIHFSQAYVDGIQKVTPEQIRTMARKYLVPSHLATISILPEDTKTSSSQLAEAASPEPVKKIVLDNGLRCLIRRDPTTPLVAIQAFTLGGVVFEDEQTNGYSRLASMLVTRGTEKRTAREIAEFFDSRGGTFDASSGNNTVLFQAEVLKADFAEAMDVVADVMLHPAFPQDEFKIQQARLLDAISRINETWRTELFSYFKKRFYGASPYRFDDLGSAKAVAAATRDQVSAFYRKAMTAPDTVVCIFGDVDATEAEALVRRLFAGMPKEQRAVETTAASPPPDEPVLYIKRKSPQRKAAGIVLGYRGMLLTNAEDRIGTAVLDTIISGYRYPTGWLHEALRGGDRNFVYEVHAINQPGLLPGVFLAYAACQPDKVSEVYRIMQEQMAKAREGKFTAAELERAKNIIVTTDLMENQTNSDRATQCGLDELYGLGFDFQERFTTAVQKVTLDEVKRMAQKYLTQPIVAVVTPAPDQVDIGVKPAAIDADEPSATGGAGPSAAGAAGGGGS